MATQIEKILQNVHPETNYALFPVHEVRALLATVQLLTDVTEKREPLLHIELRRKYFGSDSLPHAVIYLMNINGRFIGEITNCSGTTLIDILDPLHIPYKISVGVDASVNLIEYSRG